MYLNVYLTDSFLCVCGSLIDQEYTISVCGEQLSSSQCLLLLEKELVSLGAMCATSLVKENMILPFAGQSLPCLLKFWEVSEPMYFSTVSLSVQTFLYSIS